MKILPIAQNFRKVLAINKIDQIKLNKTNDKGTTVKFFRTQSPTWRDKS